MKVVSLRGSLMLIRSFMRLSKFEATWRSEIDEAKVRVEGGAAILAKMVGRFPPLAHTVLFSPDEEDRPTLE